MAIMERLNKRVEGNYIIFAWLCQDCRQMQNSSSERKFRRNQGDGFSQKRKGKHRSP